MFYAECRFDAVIYDNLVAIAALGRYRPGRFSGKTAVFDYVSIADLCCASVDCENSIPDADFNAIDSKLVGRQSNQDGAYFCCCSTYGSTANLDGATAIGVCLIR